MSYAIYTLQFTTPVHFGTAELGGKLEQIGLAFSSDSLFSALCWELRTFGELDTLQEFCDKTQRGEILLSDALPYVVGEQEEFAFYLPKPVLPDKGINLADEALQEARKEGTERKKQKKMKYLRASEMVPYLQAIRSGKPYVSALHVGVQTLVERVNCRDDEPLPYYVGTYSFHPDAGLYVIVQAQDESDFAWLQTVFESLGHTGIGGKRSSGLGKFIVVNDYFTLDEIGIYTDDKALYTLLHDKTAATQMCVSSILPKPDEIPIVAQGTYSVRRRSGFTSGSGVIKKRPGVYMIQSGSCFSKRLDGTIAVLDNEQKPPVWRNGKGLFVGLRI